jgi:hypothetical protein
VEGIKSKPKQQQGIMNSSDSKTNRGEPAK